MLITYSVLCRGHWYRVLSNRQVNEWHNLFSVENTIVKKTKPFLKYEIVLFLHVHPCITSDFKGRRNDVEAIYWTNTMGKAILSTGGSFNQNH